MTLSHTLLTTFLSLLLIASGMLCLPAPPHTPKTIPLNTIAQHPNPFPLGKILLALDPDMKHSHSQTIDMLRESIQGMKGEMNGDVELEVKDWRHVTRVEEYGEFLYDGIIVMVHDESRLAGPLRTSELLRFVDEGHHVMMVASSQTVADSVREMSAESALEFDHDHALVHDYFHAAQKDDATTVYSSSVNRNVIRDELKAPVAYRGMAMVKTDKNPLVVPILTAERTAFSKVEGDSLHNSDSNCYGEDCVLVGAIQGRNGARLTFVAGSDLMSDAFMGMTVDGAKSANAEFTKQVMQWSMGMHGVLRYRNVLAHAVDETEPKHMFTIFEDVTYSVSVEEFDMGKWVPYVADDLQLEFTMLDPYYRIPLEYNASTKRYKASFKVPDKYGVFKFVVDYRRSGYTPLVFEMRQTVRPFRLDQYERFIQAAYPYYSSMFSLMIGFFVMSVLVLYAKYDTKTEKQE